ncbi:MAG: hypothetical protein OXR07_03410 [Nitrospira sp.]|nr:hypothetical protein [Nitrospira sp.]
MTKRGAGFVSNGRNLERGDTREGAENKVMREGGRFTRSSFLRKQESRTATWRTSNQQAEVVDQAADNTRLSETPSSSRSRLPSRQGRLDRLGGTEDEGSQQKGEQDAGG